MTAKGKDEEIIEQDIPNIEEDNLEIQEDTEQDTKSYIEKLNEDLKEQQKKADEYYDSLKRNMADFDNFKKRITKERESLYTSIVIDIISSFLPVVDNLEKALEVKSKDTEYKKGVEMIYKDMGDLLKKYNVEKIPDLGETFDPEYHEAVMSVEDDKKGEKEIVEVFRKGYKIENKVVRHSLVKVAN